MACPLGATAGFLEVTGPITPTQIKTVEVNGTSLVFQFAPRTTPPTMVANHIEEDPQNTLLYKGIRYGLIDVQINEQTHKGFTLAPGEVVFELNLTFATTQAPPTYPSMVVLVVPVFSSNEAYHGSYFGQLVDTDAPAASIQTLFFDDAKDTLATSFSYQTCIELIGNTEDGSVNSFSARVFVFPMGAALVPQDAANLAAVFSKQAGGTLPPYQLPVGFRGALQTMLSFTVNEEGEKVATQLSDIGQISVTPISPVGDDFKNTIQFFRKPPVLAGVTTPDSQCPTYSTSQYKCVPFNALNDLSGNQVVMSGTSLADVVNQQQSVIAQGITSIDTLKRVGLIALIIIGCVLAVVILLPLIGSALAWLFETPNDTVTGMEAAASKTLEWLGLGGAAVTATVTAAGSASAAGTVAPGASAAPGAPGAPLFTRAVSASGLGGVTAPGAGLALPSASVLASGAASAPAPAPAPGAGVAAATAAGTGLPLSTAGTAKIPIGSVILTPSNIDELTSGVLAGNEEKVTAIKAMLPRLTKGQIGDLKGVLTKKKDAALYAGIPLMTKNTTDAETELKTARAAYEAAKAALARADPSTKATALTKYTEAAKTVAEYRAALGKITL